MNMEELEDKLITDFALYTAAFPKEAIAFITAIFVGAVEATLERQGEDTDRQITIDGCGTGRNITIHPSPRTLQ